MLMISEERHNLEVGSLKPSVRAIRECNFVEPANRKDYFDGAHDVRQSGSGAGG